jgi:hypothetical protein
MSSRPSLLLVVVHVSQCCELAIAWIFLSKTRTKNQDLFCACVRVCVCVWLTDFLDSFESSIKKIFNCFASLYFYINFGCSCLLNTTFYAKYEGAPYPCWFFHLLQSEQYWTEGVTSHYEWLFQHCYGTADYFFSQGPYKCCFIINSLFLLLSKIDCWFFRTN